MRFVNDSEELIAASRAGYPKKDDISKNVVDIWLNEAVNGFGAKSIICLLHPEEQLQYYDTLPGGGLLAYYRQYGLEVIHLPHRDYCNPHNSPVWLAEIYEAYKKLPKPVLIHCSMGQDRTGAAVEYIIKQESR
jgi:hypothetical protein